MTETVTLVGAGPGGAALLTRGGGAALRQADAVVYDRLVDESILDLIPKGAERICVGKKMGHHPVPQDEINALLVRLARQGKRTVRLKGGDCYLFGRGGEECEYLKAHGVPFRVLPGVTSALAAPAFAGIPVTHRDFCSSVHIVTAHARAGKPLCIDFEALVRTGGTLVFLMGLTALRQVTDGLTAAGMPPDMPAAVIENGARGTQRKVVSTVGELADAAEKARVHSPALIVVGRVCALSGTLDWWTAPPLHGKTLAVTRPEERNAGLVDGLRALGAEVTERGGDIVCCAHDLKGRRILLPFPSVGATENAMLAACAAVGETVICNAAREPEILDLQCYLRKLGARISGAGTSTVTVSGFRPQPFVEHTIMPDRIVAATILCAGAACGGDVELQGVDPDHFLTVLDSLSEAGCAIIKTASTVRLTSTGRLPAPRPVVTQPYPGFPTDAQPPLMAACLRAKGTTVFTENIFTNRYRHAEEFRRLGAAVSIEVTGVDRLTGAPLTSSDLRGGAAMIVAGLSAEGETEILDNGYINRGYDRFDACLSALGADVRCVAPQ